MDDKMIVGRLCALVFFYSASPLCYSAPDEATAAYQISTLAAPAVETVSHRPAPDLSPYTVDAVRNMLPEGEPGRSAHLVPVPQLYFIPYSNVRDMERVRAQNGDSSPDCVVLGRGVYTLDRVYQQINDPGILAKQGEQEYLLSRPLYIAPTASLVLKTGDWLKLSLNDGVVVTYNGGLYIIDSTVTSWDKTTGDYGQRKDLPKEKILMSKAHTPRPYLLGLEGSQSYFANSKFIGLGYQGATSTFGISMSSTVSHSGFGKYLSTLPKPAGWLVGNRIEDLFFGFYTARASGIVVVGNEFHDNVVYAIDPHDYSDNLVIARNIVHGSRFSHGIITSREVIDSWITQNLVFNNAGSGIMLDRTSTGNVVSENLVYANRGDGIAVFESDYNSVHHNTIVRNGRNGVYVRNSLNVDVFENDIGNNGGNGVEIATVDIDLLETRDFELDPYRKNASTAIFRNRFNDNFNSAVAAKSVDELTLFQNRYIASGPLYFSGDIEAYAAPLLKSELKQDKPIRVTKAAPQSEQSSAEHTRHPEPAIPPQTDSSSIELLGQLAARGVPRAMLTLARRYETDNATLNDSLYWYGRGIQNSRPSAMRNLGVLLLTRGSFSQEQWSEGLVLLNMAALMNDARAKLDLRLAPDILGIDPERSAQARDEAIGRLRKGRFWNAQLFPDIKIRLLPREARWARKRARRIAAEFTSLGRKGIDSRLSQSDQNILDLAYRHEGYVNKRETNDQLRELRNLRITARKTLDEHARGSHRAYLDRVAKRKRSAETRIAGLTEAERSALLARLEALLDLVNYHRSPDALIRLQELPLPFLRTESAD